MALRWLIYGAYGYSGKLIAHQAKRRGYHPILAGRNEASLEPVARHLEFEYRSFSLDNIDTIKSQRTFLGPYQGVHRWLIFRTINYISIKKVIS